VKGLRPLALGGALLLAACAPAPAPAVFVVSQTVSPDVAGLPMMTVRRGDGAPLLRDDWLTAESAARDHCAAQGARYDRMPPSRDYTEMRLEGGAFSFMARCIGR
jgi:hypothetical protein